MFSIYPKARNGVTTLFLNFVAFYLGLPYFIQLVIGMFVTYVTVHAVMAWR